MTDAYLINSVNPINPARMLRTQVPSARAPDDWPVGSCEQSEQKEGRWG